METVINIKTYGSYNWKKFQVYFKGNLMYTKQSSRMWVADCSWDKNHVDYFERIGLISKA